MIDKLRIAQAVDLGDAVALLKLKANVSIDEFDEWIALTPEFCLYEVTSQEIAGCTERDIVVSPVQPRPKDQPLITLASLGTDIADHLGPYSVETVCPECGVMKRFVLRQALIGYHLHAWDPSRVFLSLLRCGTCNQAVVVKCADCDIDPDYVFDYLGHEWADAEEEISSLADRFRSAWKLYKQLPSDHGTQAPQDESTTRSAAVNRGHADRALELLRQGSGRKDAEFREGQREAIEHVLEGRGRLLVVQKTGWGKSFVYFIATKLLREQGSGPALLISPLLALMRNQIAAAERMGVRAATINSDNKEEWDAVIAALARNEVDILLIAPERLANEKFRDEVLTRIADRVAMLVIDEAHCISDWGHDFRPHYRLLERIVRTLPRNLRLLATTATANNRVMDDLKQVLGPDLNVSRGDLNRPSLALQTISLPSQAERLAWLAEHVAALPGHGIIYSLTVRDAHLVADWLKSRGLVVEAYSGQSGDQRPALEQALLDNDVKALVATTALGMGFDKPDLAFVIHYQMPGSVVAYYQQVGRAGRALDAARGILLSGTEETEITNYFIESAFPSKAEVAAVLDTLEAAPNGLSVPKLLGQLNISNKRVKKAIDLLSLESPAPIAKQGTKWQLTAATLNPGFWDRAVRLTDLRRQEQAQMQEYVQLASDHMAFLIRALDGDPTGIQGAALAPLSCTPNPALVREAIRFLRRTSLPIKPRKIWPSGGMPRYNVKGKIPEACQAQPGKALCVWGDAGWGGLVRQGKYHDGAFSADLVDACVTLIREWNPRPFPRWVTAVPSLRHPTLVPDFAQRLADGLGLPFAKALVKTDARPEQKTMANSIQQARNIDGSLALVDTRIPDGPVLLVDDMVDSRWTLTVAAWLLGRHGCTTVWPLALAQTGHDDDES